MSEHIIIYNPEDIQLDRVHEFADPASSWGNEIIAELTVEYDDEDLLDWIQEWTYSTDIVARVFRNLDRPDQRHFFEDVYPNSDISEIVERESAGGDIRKYFTDNYGGVDQTLKFDLGRSQNVLYTTAFEPMSMQSVKDLIRLSIYDGETPNEQWYPTPGEILKWDYRVRSEFPSTSCAAVGSIHFNDQELEGGTTGMVIYNATGAVRDWVREVWVEEQDVNTKYPPSEFDYQEADDEYSPADSDVIRMWWD